MAFENFVDESWITLIVFFGYFLLVSFVRTSLAKTQQAIALFVIHVICYAGLNDSELQNENFRSSFFVGLSQVSCFYGLLYFWGKEKRFGYVPILVPALFIWMFRVTGFWTLLGTSFIAIRMSYLAFETIYRDEKLPGFFSYFNYLFFLPSLLMGPVGPYSDFRKSIDSNQRLFFSTDLCWKFLGGFIKFFIFTPFVSSVGYGYTEGVDYVRYPVSILLSVGLFSYLTIYFQFSGFCDMMIAYGRCLGFEMRENFRSPLLSRNPQDHWRRWHISLLDYFREVFFYPMLLKSQQRLGKGMAFPAAIFCTFVVFLGVGFWHGAGSKYLLFGLYHAVGVSWIMVYDKLLRALLKDKIHLYQNSSLVGFFAWSFTIFYLSVGYLIYFYGAKLIAS